MKQGKKNLILLIIVISITVLPLVIIKNSDFTGADAKAENVIMAINPNYKPWAKNLIELPGSEIESLMFALQAAIGAGILGYILGYFKGRSKNVNR